MPRYEAFCGVLLLLASLAWCQGNAPAYTAAHAAAYLAEVRPLVEAATERRLAVVPPVKLVSRRELTEALARETPDAGPETLVLLARNAGATLGKFAPASGTLYLLPENLAPVLTGAGVDCKHHLAIAKLVVAHELCHAVQEQEVRLSVQRAALDDAEAQLAFNATMEGHATDITDRVAEALHLAPAAGELARAFTHERLGAEDAVADLMAGHTARVGEALYLHGRAFIAGQAERGGAERVWAVLAHPPTRTTMLYRPERYGVAEATPDDAPALMRACAALDWPELRSAGVSEVGELLLRADYADMPADTRARILDGLVIAHGITVVEGDRMATLTIFRFRAPAPAALLLAAAEALAAHNADRLRESPRTQQVDGPTVRDLPGANPARAALLTYRLREPAGPIGQPQTLSVYRAVQGTILAELAVQGMPMPDAAACRVLGVLSEP